jgi:hypothetical protein
MDFFDYISDREPNATLEVFRRYSRHRVKDSQDLADGLRAVMKNLSGSEKEQLLLELRKVHPDRDLWEDEIQSLQEHRNYGHNCNCEHCQIKLGANGHDAVQHFMTGIPQQNISSVRNYQEEKNQQRLEQELQNMRTENSMKKLFEDKMFKILMLALVGFLFYKYAIKKA